MCYNDSDNNGEGHNDKDDASGEQRGEAERATGRFLGRNIEGYDTDKGGRRRALGIQGVTFSFVEGKAINEDGGNGEPTCRFRIFQCFSGCCFIVDAATAWVRPPKVIELYCCSCYCQ